MAGIAKAPSEVTSLGGDGSFPFGSASDVSRCRGEAMPTRCAAAFVVLLATAPPLGTQRHSDVVAPRVTREVKGAREPVRQRIALTRRIASRPSSFIFFLGLSLSCALGVWLMSRVGFGRYRAFVAGYALLLVVAAIVRPAWFGEQGRYAVCRGRPSPRLSHCWVSGSFRGDA